MAYRKVGDIKIMDRLEQAGEFIRSFLRNDIVERAAKTFAQAAIAAWVAGGQSFETAAIVAALAAGISAAWNGLRS